MAHNQLVSVSLSVDDSQLRAFIHSTVAAQAERFQRELQLVQKSVAVVKEATAAVAHDIQEVRERELPQLFDHVHELRASPLLRRARSMLRSSTSFTERTVGPTASTAPSSSPSPAAEASGGCSEEEDDADSPRLLEVRAAAEALSTRVAELERGAAETRERLEAEARERAASEATLAAHHTELLSLLGLERNAAYGGLIKCVTLEGNAYLQEADALLRQLGHRITAVEGAARRKAGVAELEALTFSVNALKGRSEAVSRRVEEQREAGRTEVAALERSVEQQLRAFVPWTDVDTFKVSIHEGMARAREAAVEAVRSVGRLEGDVAVMKELLAAHPHAGAEAAGGPEAAEKPSEEPDGAHRSCSRTPPLAVGAGAAAAKDARVGLRARGEEARRRYAHYAEMAPSPELVVRAVPQGIARINAALDARADRSPASSAATTTTATPQQQQQQQQQRRPQSAALRRVNPV